MHECFQQWYLNVSALSDPTPKPVTTDSDQTLTCAISNLDEGHPVEVTWTDQNDQEVSDSDTTNYSLNSGSVNSDGEQEAVLTIKLAKMQTYKSSFTYKCSVKSTQYTDSPEAEISVKAQIDTGKFTAKNRHKDFTFLVKHDIHDSKVYIKMQCIKIEI